MLKGIFQLLSGELANAEREFFRSSRKSLKESGWIYTPAVIFTYLMAGVKYIFLNFLLIFAELLILIFLSPEEGHELLTFSRHPEPAGEGSPRFFGRRLPQNDRTYEDYQKKQKKVRRWTTWTFGTAVAAVVIVSLALNLSLPLAPSSLGATNTFTQTNWGGGSSSNNAIHPTNQSGWSQYSSASSEIMAVNGGEDLELIPHNASSTQTTDTQFNAGATSTTEVVGTGNNASIKLSKALHINEYTIGASTTVASVTVSTTTANSNSTWTIAFSGTPNLARLFKNDKFTDSASKAWKVLSVAPSVYKIIVVDSEGNTPAVSAPATGAGTVGRWYASISAWEAGRNADITATGRNAIERGLPYYDGTPDYGWVDISGWTTDATHYIEIYVPLSERHRGKWDNNRYSLTPITAYGIAVYEENVRIDGLQIYASDDDTGMGGIRVLGASLGVTDIRISNNIIKGIASSYFIATTGGGIQITGGAVGSEIRIFNNIIYNFAGSGITGIRLANQNADTTGYVFNNTVYNTQNPYKVRYTDVMVARNNIANSCGGSCFTSQDGGLYDNTSSKNISSDATAPGTGSLASTTVPFVDATNKDFHLEFRDGTGNPAMNAGADLSADADLAFNTDIDGDTRSGTWDIGADDVGATLVITHSIGTASRDFSTLQAWEDARDGNLTTRKVFKTTSRSAAFAAGETITGGTSNATGTYVIEQATPSAVETYLSLDGGAGTFVTGEVLTGATSGATTTLSTILTTAGTIEKGEAYKDSTFTAGVTIDGSTTDGTHYMHLTAEPGSRHTGVAGSGAKITETIYPYDSYTVIDGLEIERTNGSGINFAGGWPNQYCTVRNNIIHGNGASSGIYDSEVAIYNNLIYNFAYGMNYVSYSPTIYNNTIYNVSTGIWRETGGGTPDLRNNIVIASTIAYDVNAGSWSASSSNNISSDATAPGTGSLTNQATSSVRFVSTASDFIDLHIMDGSVAKDAGADLSATFKNDIDGAALRPNGSAYDIGADEWFSSSPVYNSSGTFISGSIDFGNPVNFSTVSFNQTTTGGAIGKSWGKNVAGQLGDGTTATSTVPVQVSGLSNVVAIAGGSNHSLALLSDGTVKAWGKGGAGQLGDGTYNNSNVPVSVSGITNAVAIAGGNSHSLALLSDGTVKAWGENQSGQLGDGTYNSRNIPVSVSGLTNAVAIACGTFHCLALLSDGTVKAWGGNQYGELGDGTNATSTVPISVSGIINAVAITTTSFNSSLALLSDGTVKAWGYGGSGGMGNGTWTTINSTPVSVSNLTNVITVAGGGATHFLALLSDGTVKAWGENQYGELGDGTYNSRNTPVSVSGITNATAIAGGKQFSLVITGGVKFQIAGNTDNATWNYLPLPRQTGVASNRLVIPPTLDSSRYLRYKAYLSTADSAFSPQLDDLTVNHTYYATTSPYLTSSPYNTNDATNILGKIAWTATTTSGTEARIQVRSAPNSGGVPGTWSLWCGYTACNDSDYFASSTINVDLASGHPLKNGGNDQWLQYKAIFVSTGYQTPTLGSITLTYVVNAPPDLNVSASQRTSDGKVDVVYNVRDTDTATGTTTPGLITPSFSYSTDGGLNWTAITSGYLSAGNLSNKQVCDGTGTYGGLNCAVTQYTQYTATWDAKTQLNGTYATNTKIMITATDNEGANNTASLASSVFTLDVKNPVVTVTVDGTKDGQAGAITTSITDNSSAQMTLSNLSNYSADGLNGSSGSWIATSTSLTWNFAAGDPVRVYGKVKDAYQNEVTVAPDAPNTPTNATIQDTSSLNLSEFREFVSWSVNVAGDFGSYKVYRSTDNVNYSQIVAISSIAQNYYEDGSSGAWLSNGTTYYYRLTAQDLSGNISRYSSIVSDIPDGQGGTDVTPPTISGLTSSAVNTTQATITWTTDELSNSVVYYSTDSSYSSSKTVASMVTAHSATLTGLTPNTAYNFRVRSTDPLSNVSSYATGTPFTTAQGPVISGVTTVAVSGNSATVVWNTNSDSSSYVVFSTNSDLSGSQTTGTSTLVGGSGPNYEHRVSLSSLSTNAKYYFKVRSVDGSSNAAEDNNGGSYYTFTTAQDVSAPVISSVSAILSSQTSTVVSWLTNEPADSQVVYGLDQNSLTSQTSVNSTMTINHSMILSDLTAGATYYYKVISADSSANSTQSAVYNFSTTALALENTLVVTRYVESGPPVVIDKTSPLITDVKVDDITESSATVTWRTNEEADSFVEYGPPDILGFTRGQRESVKFHRVILMDLKPNARYSFRATSADASGNVSVSLVVNFQTLSPKTVAEKIGEQIEQSAREKIKDFKIENQDDIARLTKEIAEIIAQASSKVTPPRITGAEPKVEVSSSFATISWDTDRPANSIVAYAGDGDYKPNADEPYQSTSGDPDEQVTEHKVVLSNLAPGTTYHFQVRSKGLIGGVGKSSDFSFKTGEEAAISGIEIKDITKNSATIFWRTNLPATTLLEYGRSVDYGLTQSDASMNTSHTILLKNLQPGTMYHFRAGGIDKNNNSFFSPDLNFVTEALPSLLNVKIDSVKEREMTVTWFTDVISDSTVEYTNGITKKTEAVSDKQFVKNHTMTVTGLDENAPYSLKVISKDEKGNEVKSSEYNLQTAKDVQPPMITNIQTQSAVSGRDKVQTIVSWTTAEPSTSRVIYQEGPMINAANEKASSLNADFKTNHVVVFTNFKTGMVYRLRVESVDGSGNISSSKDLTILTPQKQETVIDLIVKNFRDVFKWTEKIR